MVGFWGLSSFAWGIGISRLLRDPGGSSSSEKFELTLNPTLQLLPHATNIDSRLGNPYKGQLEMLSLREQTIVNAASRTFFPATVLTLSHTSLERHRPLKESSISPHTHSETPNSLFAPNLITMGDSLPPWGPGAMPPPPGEVANFGDEQSSLQIALFVANISTYAIATVFLFLRIYTSAFINRRTDVGDCKMPFLLPLCTPLILSTVFLIASWGVGAGSIACTLIGMYTSNSCDVANES
jgi:hypothetical protein